MQALLTLYALNDEPASPGETSTAIEVPVTTQDGVTVIPTEAISFRQVATATHLVTECLIHQPVETMIESVTRLGQALVETTVTTVTYRIVDPSNPSTKTVTKYCATLSYEQPCIHCIVPILPFPLSTWPVTLCLARLRLSWRE